MTRGVFISYCSLDRDFAQRLVRDLKDSDIPVWFDESEIEPGDSIIQRIEAGIDRMEYRIVINWLLFMNRIYGQWFGLS